MKIRADPHDIRLHDIIEKSRTIEKPYIGIIGVPFDGSTRGRPGARFAPRCIRSELYSFTTHVTGIDLGNATIRDFGDVPTFYGSVERNKKEIYKYIRDLLDRCNRLIVLGGDHSITEPSFRAFSEKYSRVGLVILDAHLDMRELSMGMVSSGTVIGDIINKIGSKIRPENIVYVGVRDFVNPGYYLKKAEKLGVRIIKSIDILTGKISLDDVINECLEKAVEGVDATYISFDVDVMDCSYAPGVNSPSPLGLRPEHIVRILEQLGSNKKTIVLDVTELAPVYDPIGTTCKNVAICILHFIIGVLR